MSELLTGGSWAGGWDEPGVLSVVLIAGTTGSGLFVYSPTAAFGNLKSSITSVDGTDAFGNATLAGFTSYAGGTLAEQMLNGVLSWYTAPGAGGPWTLSTAQISFGSPNQLNLNGTGGINIANALISSLNVMDPVAGPPTAETWHSLGTLAGYTVNQARYRRVAQNNEVEFDINVTSGGANALTTVFSVTLPSAYQPITLSKTYAMASNAGSFVNPRLGITTAGAVSIVMTANTAAGVVGGAFMPTD